MFDESLCLVVVGSQAANAADRTLARSEIQSVQAIRNDGTVTHCRFFDDVGAFGVASLCLDVAARRLYYSGGTDLCSLDLSSGIKTDLGVPGLIDVHEMELIDGKIYVGNTGSDELVIFDPASGEVTRQHITGAGSPDADRHHLNQVMRAADGELYGLVHHVDGKQVLRQMAARALKSQGNGGVIRLSDGKRFPLRLHAPHTVTVVDGNNWVFDSAQAYIRIFDPNWNAAGAIPTAGWGRGAALLSGGERTLYAVCLSNIRRRYLHLFKNPEAFVNGVELIDVNTQKQVYKRELAQIEQVNNVYFYPAELLSVIA